MEAASPKSDRLNEALGALDLHLSEDDLAQIEAAVPPDAVVGDHYDAGQMAMRWQNDGCIGFPRH